MGPQVQCIFMLLYQQNSLHAIAMILRGHIDFNIKNGLSLSFSRLGSNLAQGVNFVVYMQPHLSAS